MTEPVLGHHVSPILAWHFLQEDQKLRYPPYTQVEPGQTLTVEPPLRMCSKGLHASIRPLDALRYAPGPIVCRVELSGQVLHDDDKLCAESRTVLWMADATRTLTDFSCDCVERILVLEREAGREPHADLWEAVWTVREYTGSPEEAFLLREARSAASVVRYEVYNKAKTQHISLMACDASSAVCELTQASNCVRQASCVAWSLIGHISNCMLASPKEMWQPRNIVMKTVNDDLEKRLLALEGQGEEAGDVGGKVEEGIR